jgi:glucose-6-phosphate 1-dehydrogenase
MLPVTCTEIFVRFRKVPPIYGYDFPPNYYRFRLSPELTIAMGSVIRSASETLEIEPVELFVSHQPTPAELEPYHLLLWDAMNGDASRFARFDYVREAWRILDPALSTHHSVHEYDPGSWGPPEASHLLEGRRWQDPAVAPPVAGVREQHQLEFAP